MHLRIARILKDAKKSTFTKNVVLYTFFSAVQKCIPFLLLILLAHFFSREEIGYLTLYQTIYLIALPIFTLNGETSTSINYYKLPRDEFKKYLTNVIFYTFIYFVSTCLVIIPFLNFLSRSLKFPRVWLIVIILSTFPRLIINSCLCLWRNQDKIKKYGIISIVSALLNNGIAIVLIFCFHFSWQSMAIGVLIGDTMMSLLCVYLIKDYFSFGFCWKYIVDSIKMSVPIALHVIGGWLSNSYSRIIITSLISIEATGSFGIGGTFAMILNLVIDSTNLAFGPFLYKKLSCFNEENELSIVKVSMAYYAVILLFTIIISLVGYYSLVPIFGVKYVSAKNLIIPLVVASSINGFYKVHVNYLFFSKKTYLITMVTLSLGLINVGLSYLLVSSFGIIGAAYSAIAIALLSYLIILLLSDREYHIHWKICIHKLLV